MSVGDLTRLLAELRAEERHEGVDRRRQELLARLTAIVYPELRADAARRLRDERAEHTLQPTALVHEVYLRLLAPAADRGADWQNRAHFFGIAARCMRQILVEHARARNALKRGGGQTLQPLTVALERGAPAQAQAPEVIDVETLDAALTRLAALDPDQARLVELRFFAGLTVEEAAEALHVSPTTVKREWRLARAWLRRELEP